MADEQNVNVLYEQPEETPEERRKALIRRWGGLILGTLILIACGLLVGKAVERLITVDVAYDEVVTIDINNLYGAWRFAEVSHQWAGSTATAEGVRSTMEGTVYGITEDSFVASGGQSWTIDRPQYILHALEEPTGAFDDVRTFLGDDVLGYYAVLSAGGTVQPYRIYVSLEDYWVTTFDDSEGTVILHDIYRIEKSN